MVEAEILFHAVELAAAGLLFYAVVFAIKKFKLVIWKRSWYIIALATVFLILNSVYNLYLHFVDLNPINDVLVHSINSTTLILFAVGIFALGRATAKIWR